MHYFDELIIRLNVSPSLTIVFVGGEKLSMAEPMTPAAIKINQINHSLAFSAKSHTCHNS